MTALCAHGINAASCVHGISAAVKRLKFSNLTKIERPEELDAAGSVSPHGLCECSKPEGGRHNAVQSRLEHGCQYEAKPTLGQGSL